jgi:glycosyltransferase involved in cell wall biosynthesis
MPDNSKPLARTFETRQHPMKVALFTKAFLEPTHVAIAQVVRGLPEIQFKIFTKLFSELPGLPVLNAKLAAALPTETNLDLAVSECDLVHAIYDGPIAFRAFEAARSCRLPFLLSFHGGYDTNAKIWKPNHRALTCNLCEEADAVTVVSKIDAARLASIGVRRPIEIAPVPIDLTALPPRKPIGADAPIVAIGRLVPKKGFHIAIAAFVRLPPNFRLEIIGDGPEAAALQETARNLGVQERVTFLGFLPLNETLHRLAQARFLLHPAIQAEDGNAEGTPQIILWAQAIGTPVIAGASGSISDIVVHEHSGLLVQPGDANAIAVAILRLIADSAFTEKLAEIARVEVLSVRDLSISIREWRSRYLRITSNWADRVKQPASDRSDSTQFFEKALNAAAVACATEPEKLRLFEIGGQGLIYLAGSEEGRLRAVKLPIYPTDGNKEQKVLAEGRILREARILAELTARGCQWTPRLYISDPAGRFLVREFIAGKTLQEAMLTLSDKERVVIITSLMETARNVFTILHNEQPMPFVFRDWKPRNLILVEGQNSPLIRVVDAGSIRSVRVPSSSNRLKIRIGTRNWLHWSPEMLLSSGRLFSPSTDYFSLGATIFYLLVGHPPFSNTESNSNRVMVAYGEEMKRVKNQWNLACEKFCLTANLADWVLQCLSLSAEERPTRFPI